MDTVIEWMFGVGLILLFVSLGASLFYVIFGLWRDPEWEANKRPDDRAWNEHFHRVLFVRGVPGGRFGKALNASMAVSTLLLLTAGLLKLIDLVLARAGQ